MNPTRLLVPISLVLAALVPACGANDPTASAGSGTAKFTTWGEEYIEAQIGPDPAGESGFVDGWTLKYDKFLVVFAGITVADQSGKAGGTMSWSKLVDNTKVGKKELVSFTGLEARGWDRFSYQIRPADAGTEIVAGDASDK